MEDNNNKIGRNQKATRVPKNSKKKPPQKQKNHFQKAFNTSLGTTPLI